MAGHKTYHHFGHCLQSPGKWSLLLVELSVQKNITQERTYLGVKTQCFLQFKDYQVLVDLLV